MPHSSQTAEAAAEDRKDREIADVYNAIQANYFATLSILTRGEVYKVSDKDEKARRKALLEVCYDFHKAERDNLNDRYGMDTDTGEILIPLENQLILKMRPVPANPSTRAMLEPKS